MKTVKKEKKEKKKKKEKKEKKRTWIGEDMSGDKKNGVIRNRRKRRV